MTKGCVKCGDNPVSNFIKGATGRLKDATNSSRFGLKERKAKDIRDA